MLCQGCIGEYVLSQGYMFSTAYGIMLMCWYIADVHMS